MLQFGTWLYSHEHKCQRSKQVAICLDAVWEDNSQILKPILKT